MAPTLRINLHGLGSGRGNALGIVIGLQISFDHSHVEFIFEIGKGALEETGLASAGRGNEIQGQNAPDSITNDLGKLFIGFQDIANNRNLHGKNLLR